MQRKLKTPGGMEYALFADALRQPHILIAGASGSGKSVLENGLIYTMLLETPAKKQLILLDPKRVELSQYKNLPHTIASASGYNPIAWKTVLENSVTIMDNRYIAMERRQEKTFSGSDIYIIIDEFANLICNDLRGKPIEKAIQRISCEGRAAKIHLILCTQTPKAEILPTRIRCNFNAVFALRCNKASDSRLIMDTAQAANLPLYGQGYYITPGKKARYQIPYIDQSEIDRVISHWKKYK